MKGEWKSTVPRNFDIYDVKHIKISMNKVKIKRHKQALVYCCLHFFGKSSFWGHHHFRGHLYFWGHHNYRSRLSFLVSSFFFGFVLKNAKLKRAPWGHQNGRWDLDWCLPLGFWALP